MAHVIPKDQLTAYQRWELGSIDQASGGLPSKSLQSSAPVAQQESVLHVELPTAEDLERIQQEARQEAHAQGLEEGRKAGYEEGYKQGNAAGKLHTERLHKLAEALSLETVRQDAALSHEVLDLALTVAKQMLRATLQVKPDSILKIIREALLSLPALSGHHKVVVHPDDVGIVQEWLTKEHGHLSWKVVDDKEMAPGGFRFESAHSELDASLETRWREITACLGTETTWMD